MKHKKRGIALLTTLCMGIASFITPITTQAAEPEVTPMVAAGTYHTVALRSDGTVWTWGNNGNGQLGVIEVIHTDQNRPIQVTRLPQIVKIAAGSHSNIALTKDGKVYTWGANDYWQLGNGTNVDSANPVLVENLRDIVDIDAGKQHMVALDKNGDVYVWGDNEFGQLGLDPANAQEIKTPTKVANIQKAKSITAGMSHTAILTPNNEMYIWGDNGDGQLGTGNTTHSFTPVAPINVSHVVSFEAAFFNTAAIDSNGDLYTWGNNEGGQIGKGEYSFFGVSTPYLVMRSVNKVAIGNLYMLALDNSGTVYAWGGNNDGQLGNGANQNEYSPIKLNNLTDITSIAAGYSHSLAINKDGDVYAWGNNLSGQLGNGTNNDSKIPVQVVDETGTGYFNLNAPDTRDVTISANASIPGPTYSVNIPSTIDVGDIVQKQSTDQDKIKTTEFTMTASNLNNLFGSKVNVAISTTDGNFELADDSNNKLAYQVYSDIAGTALNNNATIAQFTTNGEKKGYIKIDQSDITQRGSYKGTLTFTISVVNN